MVTVAKPLAAPLGIVPGKGVVMAEGKGLAYKLGMYKSRRVAAMLS